MSVADLHDLEFTWPFPSPKDVIVTGTFDQWSSSIHLAKGETGFNGTVKVPWGQKIAYKYIVDGLWQCRNDRPQEGDGNGNINNVLQTPERPKVFMIHAPPSLSIPPGDTQGQGYSDVETMVTAVEFLPPVDFTAIKGPLPIPQFSVEDIDQAPLVDTPVSEGKLDTVGATGAISPAEAPEELSLLKQAPLLCDVSTLPVNDKPSASFPQTGGSEGADDLHRFATHAPVQFAKTEASSPFPVPEATTQVASLESAILQPSGSPQIVQDVSVPGDSVQVLPASASRAVVELTAKQPEEVAAEGHRSSGATTPSPVGLTSPPASSTVTHKKRRSLFARIKHMFDRNNDKQGGKERYKH